LEQRILVPKFFGIDSENTEHSVVNDGKDDQGDNRYSAFKFSLRHHFSDTEQVEGCVYRKKVLPPYTLWEVYLKHKRHRVPDEIHVESPYLFDSSHIKPNTCEQVHDQQHYTYHGNDFEEHFRLDIAVYIANELANSC
jgi:hypothetical protein